MGAVRADFYLSSRSSELLIHGNDVARAMGERVELPAVAVRHVAIFLTERAVTKNGELFILAMSGREALPAGFSVY